MNLLHDIPAGDPKDLVNVIVEISTGDQTKYEYDQKLQVLRVDRFLYTAFAYPFNYGFVCGTWSTDHDPLDIVVLSSQPVSKGSLIECRLIGMAATEDEEGEDAKLVAVPKAKIDPFYAHINDVADLPEPVKNRIQHFYQYMKSLEPGKFVKFKSWLGKDEAVKVVDESIARYHQEFSKSK